MSKLNTLSNTQVCVCVRDLMLSITANPKVAPRATVRVADSNIRARSHEIRRAGSTYLHMCGHAPR